MVTRLCRTIEYIHLYTRLVFIHNTENINTVNVFALHVYWLNVAYNDLNTNDNLIKYYTNTKVKQTSEDFIGGSNTY